MTAALQDLDAVDIETKGSTVGWAAPGEERFARECGIKIEFIPDICDPATGTTDLVVGGSPGTYKTEPFALISTYSRSTMCELSDDGTFTKDVTETAVSLGVAAALFLGPGSGAPTDSSPWIGHPDATFIGSATALTGVNIGRARSTWFQKIAYAKPTNPIMHVPPSLLPALADAKVVYGVGDELRTIWGDEVFASPGYDWWGGADGFVMWTAPIKVTVMPVETNDDTQYDVRRNHALTVANTAVLVDTPPCGIVSLGY